MRKRPGQVRDAIVQVLENRPRGATVYEITHEVVRLIGDVPSSSIRSYLQLNTPELFARTDRAQYVLKELFDDLPRMHESAAEQQFVHGNAKLLHGDCLGWLERQPPRSIHAVVTDPPYGLLEYSEIEQQKLRRGKGGVWRIPPSFDGSKRSPLPRFTVLKPTDLEVSRSFF